MNAIAALKRRVEAVRRPRERRSRAAAKRRFRIDMEESRTGMSAAASTVSTGEVLSTAEEDKPSRSGGLRGDRVRSERPHSNQSEILGRFDDAVEDSAAKESQIESVTPPPQQVAVPTKSEVDVSSCSTISDQAINDRSYIQFNNEEPEDYTDGPVRFVAASDGLKQCAALLLTTDFSASIRHALKARRKFRKLERTCARRREVAMFFELDLKREIRNHTRHLQALEDEVTPDMTKVASLKEEFSVLEQMLRRSECEREESRVLLENHAANLLAIQAHYHAYLEEAFVCGHLLDPEDDEPDTPIEEIDLQQEYLLFRQGMQQSDMEEPLPPLDVSRDHMKVPSLTPEQQALRKVVDAFWEAHEQLEEAQRAFDWKEYWRNVEWQANVDAEARGEEPKDASPEDFDLRWVKRGQELTHNLLQAEEAFATAKASALEAGMDLDGAEGVTESIEVDGERTSVHEECVIPATQPRVTEWLTTLSSPLSPSYNEAIVGGDEWEVRGVGLSDSISVVAEGTVRKRIDEWQKACGD